MHEMLTKQYYGLKGWQWIAVIGMAGFVFFRIRSGGSSTASDTSGTDTSGNDTTDAGAQGFTSGYAQGYAQGNYQGSIAPNPPNPPAGSKNCRTMNDPSGKPHLVCGPGAFQNLMHPGQSPVWRWVEGATHVIYATGKKNGTPFLRPPPVKVIHNPGGVGSPGGKKPVKQQPHAAA